MARMRTPAAVLATVLALWPAVAAAEDAEALVEQGIELREAHREEEALAKFERAHALAPTPRTRAQIALAKQALGRWAAAEADLVVALAATGDAWIAKHRAALEGALATIRTHLGDLVLSGGADGAEVVIDGVRVGTLPLGALRLEVGTHALEVTRRGFYSVSKPVMIQSEVPARVALDMRSHAAGEGDEVPAKPPASPARSSLGYVVAGVGMGVAGLGLVGLGIGGIVARGAQVSAYNDDASCPPIDAATKPAACQARVDSARTWEAVGIVGFVGGAALLVGGAAVILIGSIGDSSRGPGRTNGAAFGCLQSPVGVACSGRF
jgi:hypothetical protein